MKKFLEELERHKMSLIEEPTNTEAQRKFTEMQKHYSQFIGRRALYKSKIEKSSHVVTVVNVTSSCVLLARKYFGRGYSGEIKTCAMFSSLICGEDGLEIE